MVFRLDARNELSWPGRVEITLCIGNRLGKVQVVGPFKQEVPGKMYPKR